MNREELQQYLINNHCFTDDTRTKLSSGINRFVKNRPNLLSDLKAAVDIDSDNPTELIYCLFNDERGICQVCGKPTKFVSYGVGYKKSCSRQCADILTVQKGAETKIQKYGSASYNNLDKHKHTCLEKYGNSGYTNQELREQNNIIKYGTTWINNVEKGTQTCMERYGVKNPMMLKEFQEKVQANNLNKYGVKFAMQMSISKEHYKENCKEKTGYDWHLANPEFRKKYCNNSNTMTANEKLIYEFLQNRDFNFIYQYECNGRLVDFGVLDNNNNLVLLIETDGEYYHGLLSDYDGKHVRGENDRERFERIPEGVKFLVVDSLAKPEEVFNEILSVFNLDYEIWIQSIIANLPKEFPYYTYSDKRLKVDYDKLKTYTYNKHQWLGSSLIRQFHKSLFSAHVKNKPSPVDAWNDKELLEKCVRNRFIYKSNLSSQNIADGFTICKLAPRVSVFNPSLAKYIIDKYLNEYTTVFDPFSGFSGRMLGACALNKYYIGQDINKQHIKESNEIIDFLNLQNLATVKQEDILQSSGTYDCLFTCPPYEDKEIWNGTETIKSCDEWIDVCLENFNCKKYLFVVDNTNEYKDSIVETLENKSHFGKNNEYVVLIDRNNR